MINILVTGANGQLGSEIKDLSSDYPDYNFFFTDTSNLDITNQNLVDNFVLVKKIDIIINCAAYTSVDKAESKFDLANSINHIAIGNIAKISKKYKIKLVHISTDYVFDGLKNSPYKENDITNPQSVYGKTKLDGENSMIKINPENSIIIRTSWVYSKYGNNFVKTMLNLAKEKRKLNIVSDQAGSPTNAADLASDILKILPEINFKSVEIFHYSNLGECSWYEFAIYIFYRINIKLDINAVDTTFFKVIANRPANSTLSKEKIISTFNIDIKEWQQSLGLFLDNFCVKKVIKNGNK